MKTAKQRMDQILTLMADGEMDIAQIMAGVGLKSVMSGYHYVEMLKTDKKIHVSRYEKRGGTYARIFSVGDKPDAVSPMKEWKRKAKEKTVVVRDPLVSAFFGSMA